MEQLLKIRHNAAAYLREALSDMDVAVTEDYPDHKKTVKQECIAVGLDTAELCGSQVRLTLRFDLLGRDGLGCRRMFDRLCEALLCRKNGLGVSKLTCGELRADETLSGTVLTAKAELAGVLEEDWEEDGEPVSGVLIQREEVETA